MSPSGRKGIVRKLNLYLTGEQADDATDASPADPPADDDPASAAVDKAAARWSSAVLASHRTIASVPFTDSNVVGRQVR